LQAPGEAGEWTIIVALEVTKLTKLTNPKQAGEWTIIVALEVTKLTKLTNPRHRPRCRHLSQPNDQLLNKSGRGCRAVDD
jgi:hypothetical protein